MGTMGATVAPTRRRSALGEISLIRIFDSSIAVAEVCKPLDVGATKHRFTGHQRRRRTAYRAPQAASFLVGRPHAAVPGAQSQSGQRLAEGQSYNKRRHVESRTPHRDWRAEGVQIDRRRQQSCALGPEGAGGTREDCMRCPFALHLPQLIWKDALPTPISQLRPLKESKFIC